jgi:hypothetical protein
MTPPSAPNAGSGFSCRQLSVLVRSGSQRLIVVLVTDDDNSLPQTCAVSTPSWRSGRELGTGRADIERLIAGGELERVTPSAEVPARRSCGAASLDDPSHEERGSRAPQVLHSAGSRALRKMAGMHRRVSPVTLGGGGGGGGGVVEWTRHRPLPRQVSAQLHEDLGRYALTLLDEAEKDMFVADIVAPEPDGLLT